MSWFRKAVLLPVGMLLVGCSPDEPASWNPAEMSKRVEEFGHIAEAYAVVDFCMPRIESNPDAERALISTIGVRRYTQLLTVDTDAELDRFLAYHRSQGGDSQQHAKLEQAYRDAHQAAQPSLRGLDTCLETAGDYVNTILHTRAPATQ